MYLVGICQDHDCYGTNNLNTPSDPSSGLPFTIIAPAAQGTEYTLTLQWDSSTSGFTFSSIPTSGGSTTTVNFDPVAAGAPNDGVPNNHWKAVSLFDNMSGAGQSGDITATVDNLNVDEGSGFVLHDDFSNASAILDRTRWGTGSVAATVSSGALHTSAAQEYVAGGGSYPAWSNGTTTDAVLGTVGGLSFSTPALSADVSIDSVTIADGVGTANTVPRGRAIAELYFQNPTTTDSVNDSYARVWLQMQGQPTTYGAVVQVFQCTTRVTAPQPPSGSSPSPRPSCPLQPTT